MSERFEGPDTFEAVWDYAANCAGDVHGPSEFPEEVRKAAAGGVEHVWALSQQGQYAEGESCAIGKTKDGRYIVVEESSDTTGHECQCSHSASIHETLEEAVRLGLSQDWRDEYNKARRATA